jgi:hypothetical protein
MAPVDEATRVCPHCGEPPGAGVFCAACGRNLGTVERLPTRAEWAAGADVAGAAGADVARAAGAAGDGPADPAAVGEAAAAFLAAMRAAGNPGTTRVEIGAPGAFRRAREVEGWVLRAVDREDFEGPRRYEPGLFLTVAGRFHRLDSELRGWGQRNFPHYRHSVSQEPVPTPGDAWVIDELRRLTSSAP